MPRLNPVRGALVVLLCAAATAAAQKPDSAAVRGNLEQRVRERVEAVVQERLALTDAQVRQLRDVSARYEPRRRTLLSQERQARLVLRTEMQRGKTGDQKRVADAVDELLKVQRARVELVEAEQRELATFMQPFQRAGYLALQDQMRRRVEEMRRSRGGGGTGPRRPPGRPGTDG